jgi:hypothetical protein
LSQTENFAWLGDWYESNLQELCNAEYTLFIEKSSLVFHWNAGTIAANAAGAFNAALSRVEIEAYLTRIGKELLHT